MKPKIFIASSVEHLDLAYAVQEELEHDVESTVWSQGAFALSATAMASLIDVLEESDYGVFVLSPDDVTEIRKSTKLTVRDNVIFELGLFVGRLGHERCFMIVPRGVADLHLPTDLLGLAPADFDPNRQDGNLRAALGPACNRIRKAVRKLGSIKKADLVQIPQTSAAAASEKLVSNAEDCTALIQGWMGGRSTADNSKAIRFKDVDRELGLEVGSAARYIEDAAEHWGYRVARRGADIILFESNKHGLS